MIRSIPNCESIWDDNANIRREEYKKIINSADRKELLKLLKTLHEKKSSLEGTGKNLSVSDENTTERRKA